MIRNTWKRPARTGFTLIEILVVIAIIAILISLLMSAMFKVWASGIRVAVQTDIREMEIAFAEAKKIFNNSDYLPSQLTLRENGTYPPGDKTAVVLSKMFGKNVLGHAIDWNGNGQIDGPITLYGEELLVFYLGGIPSFAGANPTVTGFSTDPSNPANQAKQWDQTTANNIWTIPRMGPFFKNFSSARLVPSKNAKGFLNYLDAFPATGIKQPSPYLYFSSEKAGNDYSLNGHTMVANVSPYFQGSMSSPQYFNPNGFQILSAGQDGLFGPGGPINGATGYVPGQAPDAGLDDLANFTTSVLGAPITGN